MRTPTVRKRRNGLRSPVAARKRIGREIAQVRKDKGYTQAAISDQIGPLQNFRHGTPPPPDLSTYASWTNL